MATWKYGIAAFALLTIAACGDDEPKGGERGDVPADATDCKEANALAKECDMEPFDCKTDRFSVECALEYPDEFCGVEGTYFSCIIGRADDYYED